MAASVTGWKFAEDLLKNKWFWIVLLVIVIAWYIYKQGVANGAGDQAELPNGGTGIPAGWSATPAATALHGAMDTGSAFWGAIGYGTDEDTIWNTLEYLSLDQRAAVNNEFNRLYQGESGMNLRQWFEDELSGEELNRALAYFNGIFGF